MSEEETKLEMMPEPAWWTRKQCSKFLNCGVTTIDNLLRTGQLVKRKFGSKTMIPRSSAEAFLRKDHHDTGRPKK
jgi:hypothetical protein